MANSDNVLRGGLTPKHVDVPNLLNVVLPDAFEPSLVQVDSDGRYVTPAPEFELRRLSPAIQPQIEGPSIVLCTGGVIVIENEDGASLKLCPTEACWFPAGERGKVANFDGDGWLAAVGS